MRNIHQHIKTIKRLAVATFCSSILFMSMPTMADNAQLSGLFGQKVQKFLPVHQAFNVSVDVNDHEVEVVFKVTPNHYVYRDKIVLNLPSGVKMSAWRFNKEPTVIDDPSFGQVAVFAEDVVARATLSGVASNTPASLRWQGCAKAGLCYPPEITKFNLSLSNTDAKTDWQSVNDQADQSTTNQTKSTQAQTSQAVNLASNNANHVKQGIQQKLVATMPNNTPNNIVAPSPVDDHDIADDGDVSGAYDGNIGGAISLADDTPINTSTVDGLANHELSHGIQKDDVFGIHDKPVLAIGLLFLAGLLLAFTPCVYPMIPIVANIVARQDGVDSKKGLLLSASYGVGVSTAYGLLGALIAWFGRTINIVGYLQNPTVLIGFAMLFVVLGFYMFDAIKVGLPAFLRDKLQTTSQSADGKLGSLGGSFLAGMLSALVVSPCVSAPMAGALAAVSTSGSVAFGFLALFALGLGLSAPLMLIGMAQGRFMPKAGTWMVRVKEFCGLLLFAVAIALIERVFVSPVVLVIWALWFAVVAVWLWHLAKLPFKAVSALAFIWTACLLLGASMGASDTWQPLGLMNKNQNQSIGHQDHHITTLADLDRILASHDKVLVDVTADWCIECRIMERELFAHRPASMADVQVVKFDITETSDESRALLMRYDLIGPPALLMYKNGKLVKMMLGQTNRADFESALTAF